MVKELVHDPFLLSKKSTPATKADLSSVGDLLDTLSAHKETCVGMAGNMIGVYKNIIAFTSDGKNEVMLNPEIIKCDGAYKTKETCLSLIGDPREVKRYKRIKVKWQTTDFKIKIKTFDGFTAEIIQHEIDHLNGVLI